MASRRMPVASIFVSSVQKELAGHLQTKPFDASACPEALIEDLSREKLDGFLARAQSQRG